MNRKECDKCIRNAYLAGIFCGFLLAGLIEATIFNLIK